MADPVYDGQLQDRAVLLVPPEGLMIVRYHELPGSFEDGEPYSLRAPTYEIGDLAYGPLHPEVMLSPRVAPAIVGMGLLETIPETDILALADPDDADSDGISGRPNMVWDVLKGKTSPGTVRLEGQPADGGAADGRRFPGRHGYNFAPVSRRQLPGGAARMPGSAQRRQS